MSGEPTEPLLADYEAAERLDENDRGQLTTARAQARNWLPALTSLTTLIATVVVLKGPEKLTDLPVLQRIAIVLLAAVAFFLLGKAVWLAYVAQFGHPSETDLVNREELAGLDDRIRKVERTKASESRSALSSALKLTMAGVAFVLLATVVAWFPASTAESAKSTCVAVNGIQVLKVLGPSLDVIEVRQGVSTKQC